MKQKAFFKLYEEKSLALGRVTSIDLKPDENKIVIATKTNVNQKSYTVEVQYSDDYLAVDHTNTKITKDADLKMYIGLLISGTSDHRIRFENGAFIETVDGSVTINEK